MSASSDRKINYNLRPSKSIERKMILDVLKEVITPDVAGDYRYVGFGSSFFTDFKIFHKGLNITDMISIESKKASEQRVHFNKPYSCIKIELGYSTDKLPQLQWDKKAIVWLDFESGLKAYMFEDVEICCRNVKPGSFLIITLRRDFDITDKDEFEKEFGDNVFPDFLADDIEPANSSATLNKMFTNKIDYILSEKFSAFEEGEKVIFKQLFDFNYRDDAKMYTFGGVFLKQSEQADFEKLHLNRLDFVGKKEKPYDISFPIITNKEFIVLNSLLPAEKSVFMDHEDITFIPKEHKNSYFNTYRYYPAYIEISDL
jgi:hypothetical protein